MNEVRKNEPNKCPKCDGEMKKAYVKGAGAYSSRGPVYVTEKEGVPWLTSGKIGSTYALVCQNCGYIELYLNREE